MKCFTKNTVVLIVTSRLPYSFLCILANCVTSLIVNESNLLTIRVKVIKESHVFLIVIEMLDAEKFKAQTIFQNFNSTKIVYFKF